MWAPLHGQRARPLRRLEAIERKTSPFAAKIPGTARAHWVEPERVAEVAFTEWTSDGRLRHPSFKGLREDKPAREIVRERPGDVEDVAPRGPGAKRAKTPAKKASGTVVAGVHLTNPDRVLPRPGADQLDLAAYYRRSPTHPAPGRDCPHPVRCPKPGQSVLLPEAPGLVGARALRGSTSRRDQGREYLVVDDLAGCRLAQIGPPEIHTWNALADDFEHPTDVFDRIPIPRFPWSRVSSATGAPHVWARRVKSFLKQTGGKACTRGRSRPPTWRLLVLRGADATRSRAGAAGYGRDFEGKRTGRFPLVPHVLGGVIAACHRPREAAAPSRCRRLDDSPRAAPPFFS